MADTNPPKRIDQKGQSTVGSGLPDFVSWVAVHMTQGTLGGPTLGGAGGNKMTDELENDPRLHQIAQDLLGGAKLPTNDHDLADLWIRVHERAGDTGLITQLHSQYQTVANQVYQSAVISGNKPAADQARQAASQANAAVTNPPTTGPQPAAPPPASLGVTSGDLGTMMLYDPLATVIRNISQSPTAVETKPADIMQNFMISGAGAGVKPEDYTLQQTAGDPYTPSGYVSEAKPGTSAFAADTRQTNFEQNIGARNRLLRANDAQPIDTSNLTAAGIPIGGVMSMAQALHLPDQMTDDQYIKFQQNLAAAGLYGTGDPNLLLNNLIHWGDRTDGATMEAWQRLLGITSAGSSSISTVLQNKQAGYLPLLEQAAKSAKQDAISRLVGDLHLTNPADIKATAEQSFINLIGRAPTDAELAQMVSGYHGKEQGAYQTKMNAAMATVGNGNLFTQTDASALPAFGGNGDPRFTQRGYDIVAWAADWLANIGAPINATNLGVVSAWANSESSGYTPNSPGGRNNPLNIVTSPGDGSVGQGGAQGNIGDYPTPQVGAQASARLFLNNRNAAGIIAALRSGAGPQAVLSAVNGFYNTWGGSIGFGMASVPQARVEALTQSHLGYTMPGAQTSRALTGDLGLNIGPGVTSFAQGISQAAKPVTITDPGSVQAYVEEQARTAHPVEYQSKSLGDEYYSMLKILSGGQLPSPITQ